MKSRPLLALLIGLVSVTIVGIVLVSVGIVPFGSKRTPPREQVDWTDAVEDAVEEETEVMPEVTRTQPTKQEIEAAKARGKVTATIETAKGNIELLLRGDLAPLTVANFVKLAKSGYYDGVIFHRVEDFCIQGGTLRARAWAALVTASSWRLPGNSRTPGVGWPWLARLTETRVGRSSIF